MAKSYLIGLGGGSGSGKTTLSRILADALPWKAAVIPMDRFYNELTHLDMEARNNVNFDHPDALDIPLLQERLQQLKRGQSTTIPHYNFEEHNRMPVWETIEPDPVIIIEGMHALLHPSLLREYDLSVFLNIPADTRLQRKIERDIRERGRTYESVMEMWNRYTQPMHGVHVQPTNASAQVRFQESFAPQVVEVLTNQIARDIQLRNNDAAGVNGLL